ncbi:MFS transporter [Paraburkholderia sp. SIMBA_009]|uniref:ACS family D-galactonate transporter-like MFS transporter n=1 Tax=Paraburkholderia tropica TaxID=92647 RepID=A0ABX5MUT6_9BURK|nr:MFS transporter [Paraburkholderia tropica]MDE1144501.1 MFS transporter [Paraburkholderia tropica]PXX17393.1 ACS family D-galactonate transporter-like MFS transporter [Paraburkholderia tropica]PZW84574.1 ACS family D-galactonate transporter-like MFS transporter [Paraburkholderia tropica]
MPRIRWAMILMCFLANVINFVDRANLAIAAPSIRTDLGLDAVGMGLVLSAFFWTYAFLQLPAGWFIDKVGVRLALAFAVGWWSVFTVATGAARGLAQLVGMRLMLGVGEAAAIPSFAKVAFNWFPRRERGLASSIFDSGSRVGSALSLPFVAWLISAVGWRGSFAVTGALGVVWALAWWFIYRDPERFRGIAPAQVAALLAERGVPNAPDAPDAPDAPRVRWVDLFRYRTVWGMMIGLFCLNFAIYFFITWFPSYLLQSRGFSLASLGTLGMLPALLAIPGGWLGGWVSDTLFKRGWSATAARKTCLVGGMIASSAIAFSALVQDVWLCLALFALSYAALSFAGANVWTLVGEVAPTPAHVASLGGIQNFAGNLAGIFITTFTGVMLTITRGSFVVPLVAAGVLCVVGALSYLFLVGKVEPLPPLAPARNRHAVSRVAH